MKLTRVRKRDGREVPFEKAKIQSAVQRAQTALGIDDAQSAVDVADLVELALARRYFGDGRLPAVAAKAVPDIEEIQDLVEQALVELGHAAVAKTYILYRDRRARIRAAEAEGAGELADAVQSARTPRGPRVVVSGGLEAWKKSRIVAALMDEADLQRTRAEEVASRVEARVFALGVKRMSTALIRELVDNELVELGLSNTLRRQRPVGMPRHDLRALLAAKSRDVSDSRATALDVGERVGGDILRRFALEDVLDEASAERHLSGEIHVEDLERPHLPLCSSIPSDLLMRGAPSARAAFDMLDDLADLARSTARGIVLEDAQALIGALARNTRGGGLSAFLCALSATSRASGRSIDLGLGACPTSVLASAIEECAALQDEGRAQSTPRLFVDARELVRVREAQSNTASRALETLLSRGQIVPTWSSDRVRCVGPVNVRAARERGALHCGSLVAINVSRAARRAGPWREDALFENLAVLLECALDALVSVREFQRRSCARGSERRGRTSYAVTPVGLREALRWLADGEIRTEHAARVTAFLSEAVSRFARERGFDVGLTPFFGERAATRFADLDAALFQVAQPLLFEGVALDTKPALGVPYTSGFDLASPEPGAASSALLPAQVAIAQALECGALHPTDVLRVIASHGAAEGGTGPQPITDALERFERARSRQRGGVHALYALPKPTSADDDELAPDRDGQDHVLTPAAGAKSLYSETDSDAFGVSIPPRT